MRLSFEPERETKGTWRFQERVEDSQLDEPRVGTLYVKKSTLREIGWQPGNHLNVELSIPS